jgi:hypothetical protein
MLFSLATFAPDDMGKRNTTRIAGLEIPGRDLIGGGVAGFGGLETAFGHKTRLVEGLAAPEQEADAVIELALTDNRISVQVAEVKR